MTDSSRVLEPFNLRDPNTLQGVRMGLWSALALVLGGTAVWDQIGSLRFSAALGSPASSPTFGVTAINASLIAIGVVLLPALSLICGPAMGRLRLTRRSPRQWGQTVLLAAADAAGFMTFLGTQLPVMALRLPASWLLSAVTAASTIGLMAGISSS